MPAGMVCEPEIFCRVTPFYSQALEGYTSQKNIKDQPSLGAVLATLLLRRLVKVLLRATQGPGFSPAAKRAQHFTNLSLGRRRSGAQARPSEAPR